jgi:hypothetical protein
MVGMALKVYEIPAPTTLLYREEEREMVPYCQDSGVGLMHGRHWREESSLGHGSLRRQVGSRRTGSCGASYAIARRSATATLQPRRGSSRAQGRKHGSVPLSD